MRFTHTGYAQQLRFGPGVLSELGMLVRDVGVRRVLLVTTEGRLASADGERLTKSLGRELGSTFAGVTSHVPVPAVQAAVHQARRGRRRQRRVLRRRLLRRPGQGGVLLHRAGGRDAGSDLARPPRPSSHRRAHHLLGAELTPFFGMTDEASRRKSGAGGPTVAPIAAVYDPELTLDTPPRVSAETGMNALAHCVEAAYSPARTPEAEAVALAGARRIAEALPAVVTDPVDLGARTEMLAGAVLGGRALQNATMGVHHGLAQLLGGRTGIAHGLANAVVLPHAMRFNGDAVPVELRRIGEALGDADDPAGAVERLLERLRLPVRLSDCGVTDEDLDAVVRLSQSSPAVQMNPKPVSEHDARGILEAAF